MAEAFTHVLQGPADDAALVLARPPQTETERLALVRRHGRETTSFQVLEQGVQWWTDGGAGAVAYADTGRAWVTAGAPLAPKERLPELAAAFVLAAERVGRRVSFCAVEDDFQPGDRFRSVPIGAQPVWLPENWPALLKGHKSLREQLRRARAKGVKVRLAEPHEFERGQPVRRAVEALAERWLATKRLPPLRFLLDVQPFANAGERRLWIAERDGQVVASLVAVPIYGRNGWFFEDILRSPHAPNGTVETLIDAGMKQCAEEGSALVTMGLVPLAGDLPGWLRFFKKLGGPLYDFRGLESFRVRLRPDRWEPIRVAYPKGQHALGALWDVLAAVAGCNPLAFAAAGIARTIRPPKALPA